MKNLKDMSMDELFNQLGISLYDYDFGVFIKDKQKLEEFSKIIDQCRGLKSSKSFKIYKKFFIDNSNYIDKERYVLITLYRLCNIDFTKQSKMDDEDIKRKVKICKELLHGSKVTVGIVDEDDILKIISVDNIKGEKKSNKNQKRLKQITENVLLSEIINKMYITDLEDLICLNPGFGLQLEEYTIHKIESRLTKQKATDKNFQQNLSDSEYREILLNIEIQKTLMDYAEYISIDKFLLTSIYRHLDFLDSDNVDLEDSKKMEDFLKKVYSYVDDKTKIKGEISYRSNETKKMELKKISYTAKDLKRKIHNNFIDGIYYGDKKIANIRKALFEEDMPIEIYDPKVINLLGLNRNELQELSKDDNNFRYLLKHKIVNDETLKEILSNRENLSSDIIKFLLSNGDIEKSNIFDLYNSGVIAVNSFSELKQDVDLQIEEIVEEQELIRLYNIYTKRGDNEKEFNKYLQLYKELKVKNKDIETKRNNGNKLIEELGENFEEKDLNKMYELGIIPVETAIEWGGESITQDMFNQGILKPIDAKRLYKNGTLNLEMIKQVLRTSNLSEEDKITLICSTFDSDEDLKIRMELIQYLNVEDKENNRNTKLESQRIRNYEMNSNGNSRNAYITDPCMRWKLISLLDEEYSQQVCKDGYIIFHLPNIKNGTVIIEKMLKKSKNGIIPSYGNATYILSEEEFIKAKENIVDNNLYGNTINLNGLATLREEEKTDRLNHSSRWGNNIKEYFDVEKQESMYTQEQIEEINKTIKSIENSRTLK